MPAQRVLDVGNCDPDHGSIRAMLAANFDAEIHRVMFVQEALARLRETPYDLVLVNRLIFADHSEGAELIHAMQRDPALAGTPIMLISNLAEFQEKAVAAGAAHGFGKAALHAPETHARLARHLKRRVAVRSG